MKRQTMWMLMIGAMVFGATTYFGDGRVWATPGSGFSGVTLAIGRFGNIDVFSHAVIENMGMSKKHKKDLWLSWQKTKGASDLYIQSNTWEIGGHTGWHTHPGHSLITVTAGAVTAYEGDDPSCTPHVYTVGMGFVDQGGDHVHIIRNEGSEIAQTMAVQLIPAGATRRIDAAANPACTF